MKILFISDLYPVKDDEKTTPKTLFNFVRGWKELGHQIDVIKPNFILNSFLRKKPFYKTGQYGEVFNVNYHTPFLFNVKNNLSEFRPICHSTKYDIVVAHMPSGILFADKLGLPFVAGIHNSDIEILTNPLYQIYFKERLKSALYNAKAIACRSDIIQKKLLKILPDLQDKTFITPSGIPADKISEQPRNHNFQLHKKIKVLTVSNLIKRKNIDKLIEALKGLENFELTVIGDGVERRKLERLDKNVKFMGRLDSAKVFEEMKKSDIFILPSVGETFGMVYLEAMASGCFVVGTKDDGIDGIIQDEENGFLTLPISTEIRKILLKIKNMDDDRLKTLSYNSFKTIKKYTEEKCCSDYLQQLLKIL